MADLVPGLDDAGIMSTACKRPYYLEKSLGSWAEAKGIHEVQDFTVALGRSNQFSRQIGVITKIDVDKLNSQPSIRILTDSDAAHESPGMHRAIAECATWVLDTAPTVNYLIFGEEDIIVSDDVLLYLGWANKKFRDDKRVLAVCAHSPGGQGWDADWANPKGIQDEGADPAKVRLLPYFSAWVWATWRDRWFDVMQPQWDWDASRARGYDWNIHTRIIPEGNYLVALPDCSRSQNIGQHEGYYAQPHFFAGSQSKSFKPSHPEVSFQLVEE